MKCEKFNKMPELKQLKGIFREYSLQTFTTELFAKIVSNVNSVVLTILPKGSISDA